MLRKKITVAAKSSNSVVHLGSLTSINNLLEVVTAHHEILPGIVPDCHETTSDWTFTHPACSDTMSSTMRVQSTPDWCFTVMAHMNYSERSFHVSNFLFLRVLKIELSSPLHHCCCSPSHDKWQASHVQPIFAWFDNFNFLWLVLCKPG